jgi:type IV pilus assembly protein PilC
MSSYCYEAVNAGGLKMEGSLEVADQNEALRRIKEMGLFPTRIAETTRRRARQAGARPGSGSVRKILSLSIPFIGGRVKARVLAVFTRQLATLVEAGMPLLRGLRTLQEQENHPALKRIIGETAASIEGGSSLSEALAAHPRVFNGLYCNMVKAGELGGALEVTLRRLAEFMEKAQKIKGKIKAAMFYPVAVMVVALGILTLLMLFIVPRFQQVFDGLLNGAAMPAFTILVFRISEAVRVHFLPVAIALGSVITLFLFVIRTPWGRRVFDRIKLRVPVVGPVFRKAAISRFARTLGTLLNSGVPILQALAIVKETAGNVVVGKVVSTVHDSVKEGDTIAAPLKDSGIFPPMVAGMVDIGEQTGALPDMLMKIADTYDDEVDNSVSALTSLLEPVMIVFLAVVVGGIVVALFLPIVGFITGGDGPGHKPGEP